jgi:hypothetical protein
MDQFQAVGIGAIAASKKALDIFARLGGRELCASVVGHHRWYLMVKGRLARATAVIDEVAGAAAGFANPDQFGVVNPACGWFGG